MRKIQRPLNSDVSIAQMNMMGKIEQRARDLIYKYFRQLYHIDLSLDFSGWNVSANPDYYGDVNIQVYIPVMLGDMWRDFSYNPAADGKGRGTTFNEICEEFVVEVFDDIRAEMEDTIRDFVDHNLRECGFDPSEIGIITVQIDGPDTAHDEWLAEIECEGIDNSKRACQFDITEKSVTRMAKRYAMDIAKMTGAITTR